MNVILFLGSSLKMANQRLKKDNEWMKLIEAKWEFAAIERKVEIEKIMNIRGD